MFLIPQYVSTLLLFHFFFLFSSFLYNFFSDGCVHNLFFKDWDESMLVDGVKTFLDPLVREDWVGPIYGVPFIVLRQRVSFCLIYINFFLIHQEMSGKIKYTMYLAWFTSLICAWTLLWHVEMDIMNAKLG